MKDLYTFDCSITSALDTYNQVRLAYSALFNRLKLPYLVAEASSGDIGGELSHEYHLPTSVGEDNVISCDKCSYVANEELAVACAESSSSVSPSPGELEHAQVWRGVTKDRSTLVNVWYPSSIPSTEDANPCVLSDADLNMHAIKAVLPDLDLSLEDSSSFWVTTTSPSPSRVPSRLLNIVDHRLGVAFGSAVKKGSLKHSLLPEHSDLHLLAESSTFVMSLPDGGRINVLRIRDGDGCTRCPQGKLKVQKAIELGHTFHLGTRYSDPLEAHVQVPANLALDDSSVGAASDTPSKGGMIVTPMQMGCHGIGVSRIIGAVADHLADDKGLNWPRAIAPFEVVVIPAKPHGFDATAVAKHLAYNRNALESFDVVLDDRSASFGWKMTDADLVGYPVIVILGRKWASHKLCEVQCRRLGIADYVRMKDLRSRIHSLLERL
jgi:prolyl-tRNA synthetase